MKYSCQDRPENFTHITDHDFKAPAKDIYYWHVVNFSEDMDKYKIIHAFNLVMQKFQRAFDQMEPKGPFLSLDSTDDISKADIIISFGSFNHSLYKKDGSIMDCPYPFDGERGVLAHAFSMNQAKPYGGQLHLDDSENWAEMHSSDSMDLLSVFLHEMGHVFDLGHSKVKGAVMYFAYEGTKRDLQQDDLLGINSKLQKVKQKVYNKYHSEIPHLEKEKKSFWQKIRQCIKNKGFSF